MQSECQMGKGEVTLESTFDTLSSYSRFRPIEESTEDEVCREKRVRNDLWQNRRERKDTRRCSEG